MENQITQAEATARWVTIITAGTIAAMLLLSGSYVEPYLQGVGPLVLLALLGAYAAATLWMRCMATEARDAQATGDQVKAALVAEQMTLPVSTLALVFLAFLACPALLRLMG